MRGSDEKALLITDDGEPSRPREALVPTIIPTWLGTALATEPHPQPLRIGSTLLGRDVDAAHGLSLAESRVSRSHAAIHYQPALAQLYIADLGSRNGTYVNGVRVKQCTLRDQDLIRVGDCLLLVRYQQPIAPEALERELLGQSPPMRRLRATLSKIAVTSATVLLSGESGTGKEVAARYLHAASGRTGALVAVNCSAIPDTLFESQLFGHVRGAFTGAQATMGFFRAAQGGTLFLDEVGELSALAQPKLLRVLEERLIYPVGSVSALPVDTRLILATNRDLSAAVSEGKFRADLFARVAEVVVGLPPLRERKEDILPLLLHSLGQFPSHMSADLVERLLLHPWPYNVREIVKLAVELQVLGDDLSVIESRLRMPRGPAAQAVPQDSDAPERGRLESLLHEHHGNVAAIARTLGCARKNVYRWIDIYQIELRAYRH